jgi:hypothetical protein
MGMPAKADDPRGGARSVVAVNAADSDLAGGQGVGMFWRRQQMNAHPLKQRVLRRIRRFAGAAGVKTHEVHFLQHDGVTRKRVRFHDAAEATAVERILEEFGVSPAIPACIFRDGREIWLEYVDGPLLDPRTDCRALMSKFFSEIYRAKCHQVEVAATAFPARVERDLRFLADERILSCAAARHLSRRAVALQPKTAWIGFDYIDPLPKNFVVRDGVLVGVDVEALQSGLMIGTGTAKAFLRWFSVPRSAFLESLSEAGVPDLHEQFEYVDLCFRSAYAKQKSFQRKRHLAPPSIFDRFLG